MEFAGGAAAALATTGGMTHPTGPAVLGPSLFEGMGEPAFMAALNAWGSGMHREVLALRADLSATQANVSGAFVQAEDAVREIVASFRTEVVTMRQTTFHEAQQSMARLVQVVDEARARFDEQDVRFSAGLGELAGRLQAADVWAQAEPARVAAIVKAAPAPPWLSVPRPTTPPTTQQLGAQGSPSRLVMGPGLVTSPAWAAFAAGRTAQGPEAPDAWARPQAAAPPGVGCGSVPKAGTRARLTSAWPRRPASAAQAPEAARAASRSSCALTRATGAAAGSSTSPRPSSTSRCGRTAP